MVEMFAICDSCGHVFGTGFHFKNVRRVQFAGCKKKCPKCDGPAHIPDGLYEFVGDTLTVLSSPERTVQELTRLAELLRAAQKAPDKAADLEKTIAAELPAFASLAAGLLSEAKKQTRLTYIALLLSAITAILAAKDSGKSTPQITVQQVIEQTYVTAQQPSAAASKAPMKAKAPAAQTKVGRNAPCPCGSGKKYKHCCGGAKAAP
jgi:hypothetical protein